MYVFYLGWLSVLLYALAVRRGNVGSSRYTVLPRSDRRMWWPVGGGCRTDVGCICVWGANVCWWDEWLKWRWAGLHSRILMSLLMYIHSGSTMNVVIVLRLNWRYYLHLQEVSPRSFLGSENRLHCQLKISAPRCTFLSAELSSVSSWFPPRGKVTRNSFLVGKLSCLGRAGSWLVLGQFLDNSFPTRKVTLYNSISCSPFSLLTFSFSQSDSTTVTTYDLNWRIIINWMSTSQTAAGWVPISSVLLEILF